MTEHSPRGYIIVDGVEQVGFLTEDSYKGYLRVIRGIEIDEKPEVTQRTELVTGEHPRPAYSNLSVTDFGITCTTAEQDTLVKLPRPYESDDPRS